MVPVTLAKTYVQENMGWRVTYLLLLDKQKQRVLPLWFSQQDALPGGIPVQTTLQKDVKTTMLARPLTLDLLTRLLTRLEGTLDAIAIDMLHHGVLTAWVSLRDRQQRYQKVPAPLNDALALAMRLNSTITVSQTVLERRGIVLTEHGSTLEERMETVFHHLCKAPELVLLRKEPHNFDFTDELRGWQVLGNPERVNYHLDPITFRTGKASLAITLAQESDTIEGPPISVRISHEGFLAQLYRGQRLRMTAVLKTEHVQQAQLHLQVRGPFIENPNTPSGYHPGDTHEVNTIQEPIAGTRDWTSYELLIDVPTDAWTITPYLIVEGEGKLWLDRIDFEVSDHHVTRYAAC